MAILEAPDVNGDRLLHIAVRNNYIHMVRMLLQVVIDPKIKLKGARKEAINKEGKRPLHIAIEKGHVEIAQLLINDGADVNAQDKSGDTSLEIIKYFLSRVADVGNITTLRDSVSHHRVLAKIDMVKILLNNKFDWTPLHYAAAYGQQEIALLILSKSKNSLNTQDKRGDTPLHVAINFARSHQDKVVQILLNAGADTNIRNKKGRTALHEASQRMDRILIRRLLETGANRLLIDYAGSRPYGIALTKSNNALFECVKVLKHRNTNTRSAVEYLTHVQKYKEITQLLK